MTITRAVIASAVIAIGAAGTARAADGDSGFYVAAAATVSFLGDADQTIANAPMPGLTLTAVNHNNTGWGGHGAVGYRLNRALRIEAEVGRTENDADSFDITSPFTATLEQDGETDILRFMANAYVDFGKAGTRLRPYVGGGVGAAKIDTYRFAGTAFAPNNKTVHIDDSAAGFAWQAMAGASFRLSPRLSLTAQYRWFDAGTVDQTTALGQALTTDIDGHHVDLGVRVSF
ncbi:MAG: outer membrane beta-barrel protein [Pseudomonadota bacterium]|nr:outer membrane beta-barrel protein [Pseudomonadota bacterium]